MATLTLNLTPELQAALLQSVECSIDMLTDMALDSLRLSPTEIRGLATQSDELIRVAIDNKQTEAWRQIEQLISLQLLYSDLK